MSTREEIIMNNRKRYKRYCIASGCKNSNNCLPDLSFFSLPKDPERRREWLMLVGREDLLNKDELKYNSYQVCTAHFDESAIEVKIIRKLKSNALPTKVNSSKSKSTLLTTCAEPVTLEVPISVEKSTQTAKETSQPSPRKRKLKKMDTEINLTVSKQKCKWLEIEVKNIKQELEEHEDGGMT